MDLRERVVELTTELVAFPTHEREQEAQEYLARVLEASGFACRLQEIVPGRPNLIAQRGSSGPLLCSHVDVHLPHNHPDPWNVRRDGDFLVGRGVLDAKGQIAAIVAACEAKPDEDALVLITCDEEYAAIGSRGIEIPDGPWTTDGGIVCEPTNFEICTAQMGNVDVHVEARGTPGHAYAPDAPGSAAHAILAVVEALDSCRFLKARHDLLPHPHVNIGRIAAGEHAWRSPAAGELDASMGVLPGTDLAEAEKEVTERLADLSARWAARGVDLSFEIADSSEAVEMPDGLPIVSRLARAAAIDPVVSGMPSWTDAAYLFLLHNVPCVVFGAGTLATAHSDLESVAVADLVRLAEVLSRLLLS